MSERVLCGEEQLRWAVEPEQTRVAGALAHDDGAGALVT